MPFIVILIDIFFCWFLQSDESRDKHYWMNADSSKYQWEAKSFWLFLMKPISATLMELFIQDLPQNIYKKYKMQPDLNKPLLLGAGKQKNKWKFQFLG